MSFEPRDLKPYWPSFALEGEINGRVSFIYSGCPFRSRVELVRHPNLFKIVQMIWKIFSRMPTKFRDAKDYAAECYKRNVIAVGWTELGDPSRVTSRQLLREKVQSKYGIATRSAAQAAGSIWSFYHDVTIGDYILCPDRKSQRVYIGRVAGHALYDSAAGHDAACPFANRRRVSWATSRKQADVEKVIGTRFGGNQTVSRIDVSATNLKALLRGERRVAWSRKWGPFLPDKEWGDQAEDRAMQWLSDEGYEPRNVANKNKGWDIECGDEVFEVKGRKSPGTLIRFTENEWKAANRLGKRYMLLLFTASDEKKLRCAQPAKFPDPANTESWTARERIVREFFLDE